MRVVLVTGAGGYLGGRLLNSLVRDPDIEKVVALDLCAVTHASSKVVPVQHDVTQPMDDLFTQHRVTAAVHLAYILDPIHDVARMTHVNVGGTENFLRACAASDVRNILITTSATAYGAWPDNPERLRETDPLRGKPGFPYVEGKLVQEQLAQSYAAAHPTSRMIRARPTVVIGPHISNFISRFYLRPIGIVVAGTNPPCPLVHEEDTAEALRLLLKQAPSGAYNLDALDPPRIYDAARRVSGKLLALPFGLLHPLVSIGWRLRLKALTEAPPPMVDYIRYSWLCDGSKVTRETDFQYRYTAIEALESFVGAHRSVVPKPATV